MKVSQVFAAKEVYLSALLGAIVGYLGLVALIASSVVIGSGQIGEIFNVVIMGVLFGALPATLVCALVVAPLGLFIATKALGWMPETPWHGALTGVLTAIIILIGLALSLQGEWLEAPDTGTLAFLFGALGIAALTGWLTQRRFLPLAVSRHT
ncbi:MAG: hypothetical protein AAF692_08600 [Pseudomonadota bacterium]